MNESGILTLKGALKNPLGNPNRKSFYFSVMQSVKDTVNNKIISNRGDGGSKQAPCCS